MFIKVIRNEGSDTEQEQMFECSEYTLSSLHHHPDDITEDQLYIELLSSNCPGIERTITISKEDNNSVYILNNEGKTIDSYRFRRHHKDLT